MNSEYTFFWDGPFSQWHPSYFTINDTEFNCAEQFMMYNKALLFGDTKTAIKIMNTNSPSKQKGLGRQVANFNPDLWSNIADHIVYLGNLAKFGQNNFLLEVLINTGTTTLVEASPYDKIWGIGLDEEHAKITPAHEWQGENRLGKIITRVRDELTKHYDLNKNCL